MMKITNYCLPHLAIVSFGLALLASIVLLKEALIFSIISSSILLIIGKVWSAYKRPNLTYFFSGNLMKNIGALCLALMIVPQSMSSGLLNSMVNLLFAGSVMWLFTANHKKTTWSIQVFISIALLVSVSFIYQQSLEYALLGFVILVVGIFALFQTQHHFLQSDVNEPLTSNFGLKSFSIMIFIGVVGSGLLFIVMPSLTPFWKLPQQKVTPTGLSDSMTPGDIANVAKSSRLAFRAEFANATNPSHADMYWRVLTMEEFDGKSWRQAERRKTTKSRRDEIDKAALEQLTQSADQPLNYSVIAEPNQRSWLYSYGTSFSNNQDIFLLKDTRLIRNKNVTQRLKYDAKRLAKDNALALTESDVAINTRLPSSAQPKDKSSATSLLKTKQLADALWLKAKGNIEEYNLLILNYFTEQKFTYSLSPPRLSGDHVDQFLFVTRTGFCAHFASAHAVLLRLKGIPARVVTGYHGGEFNPNGNYFNVYDSSAHAWVEYSANKLNWQRTDPTAAVSPTRISQGIDQALSLTNQATNDALSIVKQTPWLNMLRQHIQSLDYYWTVWVLDFDQTKRQNFISSMTQNLKWHHLLLVIIAIIVMLLGWFTFSKLRSRRTMSLTEKLIKKLYKQLSHKAGDSELSAYSDHAQNNQIPAFSSLTLMQHKSLLIDKYPQFNTEINEIISAFNHFLYAKNSSLTYQYLSNKIASI